MKRATMLLLFILAVIFLSLAGCVGLKEEATEPYITESETQALIQAEIEDKIYDVLNNTQVNPSFAPTIGNMIVRVFHRYDITWEQYLDYDTKYSVRISRTYCPNPSVPHLSSSGSITYLVDIDSGSCSVLSDPNEISTTFLVFIVN